MFVFFLEERKQKDFVNSQMGTKKFKRSIWGWTDGPENCDLSESTRAGILFFLPARTEMLFKRVSLSIALTAACFPFCLALYWDEATSLRYIDGAQPSFSSNLSRVK